jgi:hypothetical protein
MERGTELSQTVATFIIQKILIDEQGLNYLCQTAERFYAVSTVLNHMVNNQLEKPSPRLLKHIIKCYNRLVENPRAKIALKGKLPVLLKEARLLENLDESSKKCLKNLNEVIQSEPHATVNTTSSMATGNDFSDPSCFSLSTTDGLRQPQDAFSFQSETFRIKTPVSDSSSVFGALQNVY